MATAPVSCLHSRPLARQNLSGGGLHSAGVSSRHVAVHAKKNIHPKYFEESKVICNGEEVLTTSGTVAEYHVDIWSGNHPFYQGANAGSKAPEGRVQQWNKRFAGLEESFGKAGAAGSGPLKYEGKKKAPVKKGKGKK
ncbi:hypothetical protein WJX73_009077 [Symbiochloris irregularis]|uniref:50S ribosomal protein L31 n=1 Tax=Symbiochloris irregularis TaxID=706552 RepID=A0AAW1P6J1_9CHLO